MKLNRKSRIRFNKFKKFVFRYWVAIVVIPLLALVIILTQAYIHSKIEQELIKSNIQIRDQYINNLEKDLKTKQDEQKKLQQQIDDLKKQASIPIQDQVIAYITTVFGKAAPQALAVASCENSPYSVVYNPLGQNHNTDGSFDVGPFQVNSTHIPEYGDKFVTDWKENIKVAYAIYQQQGWQPWYSSEHCWKGNVAMR